MPIFPRARCLRIGLRTAAALAMMSAIDACGRPASTGDGTQHEAAHAPQGASQNPAKAAPKVPAKPAAQVAAKPTAKASGKAHGPVIVDIGASAFPYDGIVPETGGTPFLQSDADGHRFHDAPRGGRLSADKTYADPRSLLFIPGRFDPRAPAALVLFLHGNLATLSRDVVRRQHVPEQVEASRLNVLLVAPQLAVDALDSSAGHFWQPGFLQAYLHKAAEHLAALSDGRIGADEIDSLPVIVVAYSGGYLSTAFSLQHALGQSHSRIAGVVLLDALFGEEPKFADWLAAAHARTFFVSAYSRSSADLNARLEREAKAQGIAVHRALPARIEPGDVVFQPALGAVHNDFVTQAWVHDPLQAVLARIDLARLGAGPAPAGEAAGARPESACPADAPDCQAAPRPGQQ